VAAGNGGTDACSVTPAAGPGVIAVGNLDINDNIGPESNYGYSPEASPNKLLVTVISYRVRVNMSSNIPFTLFPHFPPPSLYGVSMVRGGRGGARIDSSSQLRACGV